MVRVSIIYFYIFREIIIIIYYYWLIAKIFVFVNEMNEEIFLTYAQLNFSALPLLVYIIHIINLIDKFATVGLTN